MTLTLIAKTVNSSTLAEKLVFMVWIFMTLLLFHVLLPVAMLFKSGITPSADNACFCEAQVGWIKPRRIDWMKFVLLLQRLGLRGLGPKTRALHEADMAGIFMTRMFVVVKRQLGEDLSTIPTYIAAIISVILALAIGKVHEIKFLLNSRTFHTMYLSTMLAIYSSL
jgi:hypothetical protein